MWDSALCMHFRTSSKDCFVWTCKTSKPVCMIIYRSNGIVFVKHWTSRFENASSAWGGINFRIEFEWMDAWNSCFVHMSAQTN
jgi:hypothetical protein